MMLGLERRGQRRQIRPGLHVVISGRPMVHHSFGSLVTEGGSGYFFGGCAQKKVLVR